MIGCGGLKGKECGVEKRVGKYKEDVIRKTCRSTSELCVSYKFLMTVLCLCQLSVLPTAICNWGVFHTYHQCYIHHYTIVWLFFTRMYVLNKLKNLPTLSMLWGMHCVVLLHFKIQLCGMVIRKTGTKSIDQIAM